MENNIDIKIVVPGNPIIKKNTSKTSLFQKDKFGRRTVRAIPVHYYTKVYKEWARNAIQSCAVFKTKHPEISFPITEQLNMKCLFYRDSNRIIDLSNLFAGIQDVMAGNEKWANIPKHLFQIIYDDSTRYIGSLDGSRVLLDKVNPRIEVYLTNFIL